MFLHDTPKEKDMPVDNVDHEESHVDDEKTKNPGDTHMTTTKR